jgi:hypothetical protein
MMLPYINQRFNTVKKKHFQIAYLVYEQLALAAPIIVLTHHKPNLTWLFGVIAI